MHSINFNKIITKCQYRRLGHKLGAFLLLELLAALLVVTALFTVLVYWQGVIIDWRSDALERLQAITLARSTCERLVTDRSLIGQNQLHEGAIQLTWQQKKMIVLELSKYLPGVKQPLSSLSLITMKATWNGCRGNRQTINIITAGNRDA